MNPGDRVTVTARTHSDFEGVQGTVVKSIINNKYVVVRLDGHTNRTLRGLYVFHPLDLEML